MTRKDLTGIRFGSLVVTGLYEINGSGARWNCLCDCGNICVHYAQNLKQGDPSCGCRSRTKLIELSGLRFGKLTVIKRTDNDQSKNTRWLCKCDCGTETVVGSAALRGKRVKSCGCWKARNGKAHWRWKGGKLTDKQGYIQLTVHGHPNSRKNGRIFEHVLVMAQYLGRPLHKDEIVHHKNGVRNDNQIKNLELRIIHHPHGQKVEDIVNHSIEMLKRYAPDKLATGEDVTEKYR